MDENMLTVEQVATRLGFSIETVRRFIKWGTTGKDGNTVRLKAVRMGREYRIQPLHLKEFVDKLSRAA